MKNAAQMYVVDYVNWNPYMVTGRYARKERAWSVYRDNSGDQCSFVDNARKNRHGKLRTTWKLWV